MSLKCRFFPERSGSVRTATSLQLFSFLITNNLHTTWQSTVRWANKSIVRWSQCSLRIKIGLCRFHRFGIYIKQGFTPTKWIPNIIPKSCNALCFAFLVVVLKNCCKMCVFGVFWALFSAEEKYSLFMHHWEDLCCFVLLAKRWRWFVATETDFLFDFS